MSISFAIEILSPSVHLLHLFLHSSHTSLFPHPHYLVFIIQDRQKACFRRPSQCYPGVVLSKRVLFTSRTERNMNIASLKRFFILPLTKQIFQCLVFWVFGDNIYLNILSGTSKKNKSLSHLGTFSTLTKSHISPGDMFLGEITWTLHFPVQSNNIPEMLSVTRQGIIEEKASP